MVEGVSMQFASLQIAGRCTQPYKTLCTALDVFLISIRLLPSIQSVPEYTCLPKPAQRKPKDERSAVSVSMRQYL